MIPIYRALLFLAVFFIIPCFSYADDKSSDISDYQASKSANAKWDKAVEEGITAYHDDDYETAWKSLYQAYGKGCRSPIVLFQLALIAEMQENFSQSLDLYREAKKGFSTQNKTHRYASIVDENYARCLYMSGEEDAARELLEKAAKKSKSFWLIKMLGLIAYDRGDALEATAYFERAVRLEGATNNELISIYSLLAKLFINKGEQDAALRYYSKVLELDPQNQEAQQFVQGLNRAYQKTLTQSSSQKQSLPVGPSGSLKSQMDNLKKMINETE